MSYLTEQNKQYYHDIKSGKRKQFANKNTEDNISELFCSLAQEIAFIQSSQSDISGLINCFNDLKEAYKKRKDSRQEIDKYKQGYEAGLKRGQAIGFSKGYESALKNNRIVC